jgi:hypothetical protein
MTYRALLIGNSIFEADAGLNGLNAPVKDVARLHKALVNPSTGMFDEGSVRLVTEATCDRILDELDEFFSSARRDDLALLYYSGHGVLDAHGQLYLCGRNTVSIRLLRTAVGNRRINEFIHDSACQRTVIVLDCCSSGLFKGGGSVETQLAGPGRYIVSSTRGAELANDAALPTGTSLFTEYFVQGLLGEARAEDGYIALRDIYDYTRTQLAANTTQVPHCRFDGDPVIRLARVAKTPEAQQAVVERVWDQPALALAETYIAHRDVDPDERLRDERIAIHNFTGQPLDLVTETDDDWIDATVVGDQLIVGLHPRIGVNRAKVTVRDWISGTSTAVRFLVQVLPSASPVVPTGPAIAAAATERPTHPEPQPKGPDSTSAPQRAVTSAGSPPTHTEPAKWPPPPNPPGIDASGAGAPRSRPRRKVVVAAVALLGVAAAICIGLVVAQVANPTHHPTYGGVTVTAAKGWGRADDQPYTNARDFNPPNATAKPLPILRIGFIKFHADGKIAAEADYHVRAQLKTGAQVLGRSPVRFLGGDAVDIEFVYQGQTVIWHAMERLWIHNHATRLVEYAAPAEQWNDQARTLFYRLAAGTRNS